VKCGTIAVATAASNSNWKSCLLKKREIGAERVYRLVTFIARGVIERTWIQIDIWQTCRRF